MNIFSKLAVPATALKSLPELARQWSKAIERGKGVRLNAADLELLTSVGVNDVLQSAAAQYLKETTLCRKNGEQTIYTTVMDTGSLGTAKKTEHAALPTSLSNGMTAVEAASAQLAHAQTMFKKRR